MYLSEAWNQCDLRSGQLGVVEWNDKVVDVISCPKSSDEDELLEYLLLKWSHPSGYPLIHSIKHYDSGGDKIHDCDNCIIYIMKHEWFLPLTINYVIKDRLETIL